MMPPAVTPPPPSATVIRPLRILRFPSSTNSTNASSLTPEEQVALIELQRIKASMESNPIVPPPNMITPNIVSPGAPAVTQSVSTPENLTATILLVQQPPVVVETFPVSGARDVPAGETDIRVRFSKPMQEGSWSWSTAWENSTPESLGAPHYLDDGRTCVMKVRLEPNRTYGWWLNSDTFHNFKDQAGLSAVPYLLIFQTKPN
jgi:hypothetical protein